MDMYRNPYVIETDPPPCQNEMTRSGLGGGGGEGSQNGARHWAVDKFHAYKHSRKCQYTHLTQASLARRLRNVNTVVAKQV